MPNSKTHDKITVVIYVPVMVISYVIINNIFGFVNTTYMLLLSTTYLFSSFMFNGDLDCKSTPYNRWWLLKVIWIPYRKIFTHRSVYTHGFIIGTVIRLLYLFIIPIIIICFNDINLLLLIYQHVIVNYTYYTLTFIGLELGAMIHTLADRFL